MSLPSPILEALYALGIGLFVGLEREHHRLSGALDPRESYAEAGQGRAPLETTLGVRTIGLLGLLGWLAAYLGDVYQPLLPTALIAVVAFLVAQYALVRHEGMGLTTEMAGVVVLLLGVLVRSDPVLAVELGLATTLLLVSKPWFAGAVARLRRIEITATVQLLILIAIVLPMLPSDPVDPWKALPPRKVGIFIALIAGVEYVGYVLSRLVGPRRGASITGLLGGMTSSTATTLSMARAGRRGDMLVPSQIATFLANATMPVRVLAICWFLSPPLALPLAAPLGVIAVAIAAGAIWRWRSGRRAASGTPDKSESQEAEELEIRNPFALLPALAGGAILCGVLLLAAAARELLGPSGLVAAGAVSGIADVDAITLAAARASADGSVGLDVAALAVVLAVMVNTGVKAVISLAVGGRRFGLPVVAVFAAAIAAAAAVALLTTGIFF